MATCHLCPPDDNQIPDTGQAVLDHVRVMHPDQWEEPQRWPDGALVVDTSEALNPADFQEAP